MALIAALTALALPSASEAPAVPLPLPRRCQHVHNGRTAHRGVRTHLRHYRPRVKRQRVQHFIRCSKAPRRQRRYARRLIAWRHSYGPRWRIAFNRLAPWERAWAYSTGACESGNNPATATGNGYYGAFQFLLSTWWAAGGTGSPSQHSWHYQAVIAVNWMRRAGAGQWPVCG